MTCCFVELRAYNNFLRWKKICRMLFYCEYFALLVIITHRSAKMLFVTGFCLGRNNVKCWSQTSSWQIFTVKNSISYSLNLPIRHILSDKMKKKPHKWWKLHPTKHLNRWKLRATNVLVWWMKNWTIIKFLLSTHQNCLNRCFALREKSQYSEFFWSVFSRIWTEYLEILSLCIQSKCGKIWTRKTSNTDTFHAGLRSTNSKFWKAI